MSVVGIGQSESIGHAIKKSKQRRDVPRLGNLRIRPAVLPQRIHLGGGGAVGVPRDELDELQKSAVVVIDGRLRQASAPQRLDYFITAALQLQEITVRAQSVRTVVQT